MSIGWVLLIAAAAFIVGCITTEIWFLSHGYQSRTGSASDRNNIIPLRRTGSRRGDSSNE